MANTTATSIRSCGRATTAAAERAEVTSRPTGWAGPESNRRVDVLTYNDTAGLRARLAKGDVAAVLVRP